MSRPRSRPDAEQASSPVEVSVVVCAYTEERWDDIVSAIESVDAQSHPAAEIVLVIDHNDVLGKRAREHFGGSILVVDNHHQKGLSGARNTGIEASSATIIAFLDDDAVASHDWIEKMLGAYKDSDVLGVGGSVEPMWLTARPAWWPAEFDWVVGCSYVGLPTRRTTIRNPIGANMSVRRESFDAVGGFSPAIGRVGKHPVGCEETELFIRIRQCWPNAAVIYEPSSSVAHKVPATRATYRYFRARCYAEGLSKAVVSRLVGSQDGLSSEWTYTLKTLPLGAVRGLRDGFKGDSNGFLRAGAIVTGFALTLLGYARGRLAKNAELTQSETSRTSEAA